MPPRRGAARSRPDRLCRATRLHRRIFAKFKGLAAKTNLRPSPMPIPKEMYSLPDYEAPGEYHGISAQMIGALLWVVRCSRLDLRGVPRRASLLYLVSRLRQDAHEYLRLPRVDGAARVVPVDHLRRAAQRYLPRRRGPRFVPAHSTKHHRRLRVPRVAVGICGSSILVRATVDLRSGISRRGRGRRPWRSVPQDARLHVSLISQVQRRDDELCVLGSDSTTALIALDTGITPGMKYLWKNQRISIASLSDGITTSGTHMLKVDRKINVADLVTKALPLQRFEFVVELMGVRDFGCPRDPPRITTDLLIQAASKNDDASCTCLACSRRQPR